MGLTSFRSTARRHAHWTAWAIVGVFVAILTFPLLLQGPTDYTGGTGLLDFATLVSGIPWQITLSAGLLLIVWLLEWWDITQLFRRYAPPVQTALLTTILFPLVGIAIFTMMLIDGGTQTFSPLEILSMIFALNFFVGLSEELLFRGILFGGLREKMRLGTAIVMSSIAFGLLHAVNFGIGQGDLETLFQIVNAAALGLLFCALVLQGQSLWPAIILHMIWNSYAMMGIASSEFATALPQADGATASLTLAALILPATVTLIALIVLWQYRKRTGHRFRAVVPVMTSLST